MNAFKALIGFLSRKTKLKAEDIQLLATIHRAAADVIALINQVYSISLMLFFGGIFCLFNIFLFSLVVSKNYFVEPHEIVISTLANFEWNLYDIAMIFTLIRSTTAASGEGKRTMNVIYKIVNASTDGKLNGRVSYVIENFLLDLMASPLAS